MVHTAIHATRMPAKLLGLCLTLVCSLLGSAAFAQGGMSNASTTKEKPGEVRQMIVKAKDAFDNFDLDQAIKILNDAAGMNGSVEDRKDIFIMLGRAYFAKDMMDKAKGALKNLAELSPPRIDMDPDVVPPQFVKMYYTVCKEQTGSPALEQRDPGLKTMAVLDFRNRLFGTDSKTYDGLQLGFADLLINQLNGTVNLKVVERERIAWILEEIGLNTDPSKVDQASAVRAGKLLGVQTILFGSYVGTKDKMKLTARLVKVETGEIIGTEEVPGEIDDFFELTEKLATRVAKIVNVKASEADFKERTPTRSTDAWILYSDGVALYDKGEYKAAFDKFQEAISADPQFEKAKKRLESLRSLIG
jgi:TolB-like protein